MTESKAIGLCLEYSRKHIVPADKREDYELAYIQCVVDFYKSGYEIVPRETENKEN